MLPFDPIALRDFWLQVRLQYTIDNEPRVLDQEAPGLTHISHNGYAGGQTSSLVSGYLLGLSKELRATTDKHIAWMESMPEPDRAIYIERGLTNEGWRDSLYDWRQSLGVSQWLARGDRAFAALTAAAAADWQLLELASPALAARARATRRNYMSIHLATALAGDAPLIGLKIYEAAGATLPMGLATSPVRFGHWACRHLVDGGSRDAAFVARGKAMLTANLLPTFYHGGKMFEAALWLKAIYFDSGVVQTPEQTFARAYDCMPGISRPDFIPA
ncbi:hypothetical protein [Reyranella soli]|uniref:Alginate lyase domain-containing protein n=1 Tax=Reyranella soli TaxID=1230389 RepID=A0A512NIH4_9HYPH|nr:hypothetical protein [Reyranella soli]GEP58715.1 hypothetical protein RSO01_58810 [Reyranella soli]